MEKLFSKKVVLEKLIKVTPGKHHGWYKSNVGIIRKPLSGSVPEDIVMPPEVIKPRYQVKLIIFIIILLIFGTILIILMK